MKEPVVEIKKCGLGATLQDTGRMGWRRFWIPLSGAMDAHAAGWANLLVGNQPNAPVLELLLQGTQLVMLQDAWIAITGADAGCNLETWRTVRVTRDQVIRFPRNRSGVWIYVAIDGGFEGPRFLGSASVYPRAGLGSPFANGSLLNRSSHGQFAIQAGVAGRFTPREERRDYDSTEPLRLWRGPQWDLFPEKERQKFFAQRWTISPESDRVGYRLAGTALALDSTQIISEPMRVGSVQIPQGGLPIVIMRDGPPVGGYAKLGILDPDDLSRLTQYRPGLEVEFRPVEP